MCYPLVWLSLAAKSKALNLSHLVYYIRYYIFEVHFVCFVRKWDCLVVMKSNDYSILSEYRLISSKVSRFPKETKSEFRYCGNMWELCNSCHASFYKYHYSSISPSQHDINRMRAIWNWLLQNDNQTSRTIRKGERKTTWRPKGNRIHHVVNLTIILNSLVFKVAGNSSSESIQPTRNMTACLIKDIQDEILCNVSFMLKTTKCEL